MAKRIDSKLFVTSAIACLAYLLGFICFTFFTDNISDSIANIAYWTNETILKILLCEITSRLVLVNKIKLTLRLLSSICFCVYLYQVVTILGIFISVNNWCLFLISYIIIILLIMKYGKH